MSYGVSNDQNLITKLFYIFDNDSSGDLQYEELAFGLEMFKENSNREDKIKNFFEICDADGSGSISKQEFINLLTKSLINPNDKKDMNNIGKISI